MAQGYQNVEGLGSFKTYLGILELSYTKEDILHRTYTEARGR